MPATNGTQHILRGSFLWTRHPRELDIRTRRTSEHEVSSQAPPVPLVLSSPGGRWLVVGAALGSGMAFLDGSVVNVALPAIGREVGGGFSVLQWVLDGYLLSLSALLLLGGALGDRYGRRRVFGIGLVMFTVASLGCGLAPTGGVLILARLGQVRPRDARLSGIMRPRRHRRLLHDQAANTSSTTHAARTHPAMPATLHPQTPPSGPQLAS